MRIKNEPKKGGLKSFLGVSFCLLPTQYNSPSPLRLSSEAQGQTVLLTRANASQPPKCHSLSKKDLVAL
jgi:hypothetical protein